ncbi:MAG: ABC transporter substrate-binding protein [Alphaproteobacteria bacterium]
MPYRTLTRRMLGAVSLGALALAAAPVQAQNCTITIGIIISQTGQMASIGAQMAKSAQFAVKQINDAGGVNGCAFKGELRDDQTQASVAVDQAKQLVDISRVPVLVGSITSAASLAMLTSVTVPSKIVQITPASSSPTFTTLAKEGKTEGRFFRTFPSDALGAVAAAKAAYDHVFKKPVIVYVNNDYGVNLAKEFQSAFAKLGGKPTQAIPYNPGQASYAPEVAKALQGDPEGLYMIGTPGDGTTFVRTWISQGGKPKFLFSDGMLSDKFFADIGVKFLGDAWGTRSSGLKSDTREAWQKEYDAANGTGSSTALAVDRVYDATVIAALAIQIAGSTKPDEIKDAVRKVQDEKGEVVGAGLEGLKRALALAKDKKPIRYAGVLGPIQFDQWGDITGPFLVMKVNAEGKIAPTGTVLAKEEIDRLMK